MENMQDEQTKQAKLEALRHLRDNGFYEPQIDNPEGLNLDEGQPPSNAPMAQPQQMPIQPAPQMAAQAPAPSPDQTMQQNPQMLMDALKRKREQELMKSLFPEGVERQ